MHPFRRLFEASILFFCTVLFLRAIAVEPFGVPTGSMAEAFIGNHRRCECPRCGFPVRVGVGPLETDSELRCPNCGHLGMPLGTTVVPGDRVLVDKLIYDLRDPRRWEAAVFLRDEDPGKPYVKRVVALPGERVMLDHGEVYIDGHLARKSLDECKQVRVLIHDQSYVPESVGWAERWVREEPESTDATTPEDSEFGMASFRSGTLVLDGRNLPPERVQWVSYRNRDLDTGEDRLLRNELGYNGAHRRPGSVGYPVRDFMVECEFRLASGAGVFGCRLEDGADRMTLRLEPAAGVAELLLGTGEVVRSGIDLDLKPGETHRLTFCFFDRRATAELDGKEVFEPFDLPMSPRRDGVTRPLQFGVSGTVVEVEALRLYRDLYYTPSGRHAVSRPLTLGEDEYFLLGDNSANSEDGRFWDNPGVKRDRFLGKPFLLHQPSRVTEWSLFGDPEPRRVVDWDRIRWVR